MPKILRNNTASPVIINDVGRTILVGGQLLIDAGEYPIYSRSSDVVSLVGDSSLIVNNGDIDLSISEGIRLIQGNFPEIVDVTNQELSAVLNKYIEKNVDPYYDYVSVDKVIGDEANEHDVNFRDSDDNILVTLLIHKTSAGFKIETRLGFLLINDTDHLYINDANDRLII